MTTRVLMTIGALVATNRHQAVRLEVSDPRSGV